MYTPRIQGCHTCFVLAGIIYLRLLYDFTRRVALRFLFRCFLLDPPACGAFLLFIPKNPRSPLNPPGEFFLVATVAFVRGGTAGAGVAAGAGAGAGAGILKGAEDVAVDILVLATILFRDAHCLNIRREYAIYDGPNPSI